MTYLNDFYDDCPDSLELELQYLNNDLARVLKENPQHHLYDCPICQKYLNELDGIYKSIVNELSYPVSNKVLDLACNISPWKIQKGFFICKPVAKKLTRSDRVYQIVMVFFENGKSKRNNFSDFSFKNQQDHNLNLRIVSDPGWNKLLLFFRNKKNESFVNWSLTIPGIIEQTNLSINGTAFIPLSHIEDLNKKLIYFNKKNKKTTKKNLLRKFQESLIIQ